MNIYLIGMRGVGKTAAACRLAGLMDRPFVDMDADLVNACGMSIRDFVAAHGWKAFRRHEKALLKRIAGTPGQVVATGGGVVTDDENIEVMRGSGWVVWLRACAATLCQRLAADSSSDAMRPALTETLDPATEIETLLRQRQPRYARAMHLSVATDGLSVETVSRYVLDRFNERYSTRHSAVAFRRQPSTDERRNDDDGGQ